MQTKILSDADRGAIQALFASLNSDDLYFRFCHTVRPEWVSGFVSKLNFEEHLCRGIFENGELVAMSELGQDDQDSDGLEFAIVVHSAARRRGTRSGGTGLASQLLAQAREDAKSKRFRRVNLRCISENVPMVRCARKAGVDMRTTFHGEMEGSMALLAA